MHWPFGTWSPGFQHVYQSDSYGTCRRRRHCQGAGFLRSRMPNCTDSEDAGFKQSKYQLLSIVKPHMIPLPFVKCFRSIRGLPIQFSITCISFVIFFEILNKVVLLPSVYTIKKKKKINKIGFLRNCKQSRC